MANFPVIFPADKLSHALGIRKQRSDPLGQSSQDPETLESEQVLLLSSSERTDFRRRLSVCGQGPLLKVPAITTLLWTPLPAVHR